MGKVASNGNATLIITYLNFILKQKRTFLCSIVLTNENVDGSLHEINYCKFIQNDSHVLKFQSRVDFLNAFAVRVLLTRM